MTDTSKKPSGRSASLRITSRQASVGESTSGSCNKCNCAQELIQQTSSMEAQQCQKQSQEQQQQQIQLHKCDKELPLPTYVGDRQGSVQKLDSDEDANSENKSMFPCINMPLVPLKVILFCWYGAGACLLPYMTLHMKQLGLTIGEFTTVYSILPIIQLIGTPLAGFMADRTGGYKSVLMLSLTVCIVTTTLIQFAVPARKPRDIMAANNPTQPSSPAEGDDQSTILYAAVFWIYLIVRIFHQVAVGLSYVLLDTTTLILAEKHNSDYGRQRFWAILATGVFSPICGLVVDLVSEGNDEYGEKIKNYDPAFYFFNVLTAITLIKTYLIDIKIAEIPTTRWGNVMPLLKSISVWIFLFSVFIMGSCWGFLESFLFVYLVKLGAPTYLLGLTVTTGAFIGLPFLYCSDWFIKKYGALQLLLVALVVYFIRLIGYSSLENPWWCLPFELMEAFTLHLMWVATVRLAYQISPPGMLATMQAVVGSLNFGVGRGFGSFLGGAVSVLFGYRVAFRVIGWLALATAILYSALHLTILEPLEVHDRKNNSDLRSSKRRRQTSKDVEASRDSEAGRAAAS